MRPTALIRIKDALRDILDRIDLVASGAPHKLADQPYGTWNPKFSRFSRTWDKVG